MGLFDTFWNSAKQNEIDNVNYKNSNLQGENYQQQAQLKNQEDLMSIMRQRIDELEIKVKQPVGLNLDELELEQENEELKREVAELKREISGLNNNKFADTEKTSTLATWMIWQRAYKEQAMNYGKLLGKSQEDVVQENLSFQESIRTNQSEFDNNVSEDILLDSKEFKIIQEERLRYAKSHHQLHNDIRARNNKPLVEDDSETKYPVKEIVESLHDYQSFLTRQRKSKKALEERDKIIVEKYGTKLKT